MVLAIAYPLVQLAGAGFLLITSRDEKRHGLYEELLGADEEVKIDQNDG